MGNRIMLSYGSAVGLGLIKGLVQVKPTTAYFYFKNNGCRGSCAFCPQSTTAQGGSKRIARVDWPEFSIDETMNVLQNDIWFRRICIQCSDEPMVKEQLPQLIGKFKKSCELPISVSTSPLSREQMEKIRNAGAERLTIPIDCANAKLLPLIKGKDMKDILNALEAAVDVFGPGKVGSHLIIGLGETEMDAVLLMHQLQKEGIVPSLFAFTPVAGSRMERSVPPNMEKYRRMQIARHLLVEKGQDISIFNFDLEGRLVGLDISSAEFKRIFEGGDMLMVHGCPDCNRPYFNERITGPIYNYAKMPEANELLPIEGELVGLAKGDQV
ncbi:MAG: radical SAM protein [Candidatus Methanomethylicus sp.]|nr:radical SAM protein [Candidatus Methanomethylicus sp.]